MSTLAPRALDILHEWVQSDSLRRHCYAVADSMRHFAQLRGADADLWEAVGLLHDMDYERYPNLERSPTEGHPFVGVAALREQGWAERIRPTFRPDAVVNLQAAGWLDQTANQRHHGTTGLVPFSRLAAEGLAPLRTDALYDTSLLVTRRSSAICCSVRAVPSEATTFWNPSWWGTTTSM